MEDRRTTRRTESCEGVVGGKRECQGETISASIQQNEQVKVSTEQLGKTFRVLYSNVQSIVNKLDELSSFAFVNKPDFIAICESWGNADLTDSFFSIPGFELVGRDDRKDTTEGIGGGLLLYAKNDIVGRVTELRNDMIDKFTQACAVKINLEGSSDITLVLLYRPHHIYKDTVIQNHDTK